MRSSQQRTRPRSFALWSMSVLICNHNIRSASEIIANTQVAPQHAAPVTVSTSTFRTCSEILFNNYSPRTYYINRQDWGI